MKKAKSQSLTCSLEKNGLHLQQRQNQNPFVNEIDDSSMIVDEDLKGDASDVSPMALGVGCSGTSTGIATNLSRKKAIPPQPTKKLVIKLLKAKPILPTNFEEDTWAMLKSAISAIFLKQPNPCGSEKLYQAVYELCLHKMGGSLYQRIEKECGAHISAALQSLVGQSPDLVLFLSLVEKCWLDLCDQMLMIRGPHKGERAK